MITLIITATHTCWSKFCQEPFSENNKKKKGKVKTNSQDTESKKTNFVFKTYHLFMPGLEKFFTSPGSSPKAKLKFMQVNLTIYSVYMHKKDKTKIPLK